MVPVSRSRSASIVYLMVTTLGAGEPFGESFNFSQDMTPACFAWLPVEFNEPSKLAEPPIPVAGSTKPDAAMSMSFTFKATSKGVLAASFGFMGPALPDTLALPPPGRLMDNLNGNCDVAEKSVNSIFSLSYTFGLAVEFALPTVSFPSLISNLATDSAGGAPGLAGSEDCFALDPPRLEKFQLPLVDLSNIICGPSRTIPVTFNSLEKMSGINSTPTFNDFAVMNGNLLNAGSS